MLYIGVDLGTSACKFLLMDEKGQIKNIVSKEYPLYFPQPGWVEHDANEIWETQLAVAKEALKTSGICAKEIAAIGITNQRETTVVWDKESGEPICHAIVWQCRRTSEYCDLLKEEKARKHTTPKQGFVCWSAGHPSHCLMLHFGSAEDKSERENVCGL